jgi:hypothetical protein
VLRNAATILCEAIDIWSTLASTITTSKPPSCAAALDITALVGAFARKFGSLPPQAALAPDAETGRTIAMA